MLAIRLADDLSRGDVQRREQRGGPVALVVVCHRLTTPLLHRQTGLRAVQGLDLALLVKAEHRGVVRRVEVQPDHIAQLLFEARVIAEFEGPNQVRLQSVGTPHPVDEAVGRVQVPRHRPARPMGRVDGYHLRRRVKDLATQLRLALGVLATVVRPTRAFLVNTRHPLFRNTTSPAPDLVCVGSQLRGDRLVRHPLGRHQNDSCTLAQSYRGTTRRSPPFKLPVLFFRQGDFCRNSHRIALNPSTRSRVSHFNQINYVLFETLH